MPTKSQKAEQRRIQKDWREFCERYLYTQVRLAHALGVSRRTVQYVLTGRKDKPQWLCIPSLDTQAKFHALKKKVEREHAQKETI